MTSHDGGIVVWLVGVMTMAAGIVGSGCMPGGAASTREAASPLLAATDLSERKAETTRDGELPLSTDATTEHLPAVPEEGADERRRTIVYTGAAVAGLSAVAGVSFAIVARVKSLDADDRKEELSAIGGSSACAGNERVRDCLALRRLQADAAMFLNMTVWSLVGAGVVELAIGIYGGAAPSAKVVRSLRVNPVAGVGSAAMVVRGEF